MHTRSVVALFVGFLPFAALLAGCAGSGGSSARGGAGGVAGLLVTLDDGDLGPRIFVDGVAEPRDEGAQDTITVIRLPLPEPGDAGAKVEWSQTLAPNSAVGGSCSLIVSSDGRLAAAALMGGSANAAPGRVTLIDLAAGGVPGATKSLGAIDGPSGLSAIAFRPDGAVIAMLGEDGTVGFAYATPEGFGPMTTALGAPLLGDAWSGSSRATGIAWSPEGDRIAMTIAGAQAVAIFAVELGEGGAALTLVGAPARGRANPSAPTWTPDGRHVLVAERAIPLFSRGIVQRSASGTLGIVRVDGETVIRAGEVRLERGVDAYALSPDGTLVVAVSRRPGDEIDRGDRMGGTLTLVSFDRGSGAGRTLATARGSSFPSAVAFDGTGRSVMVADYLNNEAQLWTVRAGGSPKVEYTGVNVGVGAGPHAIAVTR